MVDRKVELFELHAGSPNPVFLSQFQPPSTSSSKEINPDSKDIKWRTEEQNRESLVRSFYDLLVANFPLVDELDSEEEFLFLSSTSSISLPFSPFTHLFFAVLSESESGKQKWRVVAGASLEYYALCNVALLGYLVVAQELRGCGFARKLIGLALRAAQWESKRRISILTETEESNEKKSYLDSFILSKKYAPLFSPPSEIPAPSSIPTSAAISEEEREVFPPAAQRAFLDLCKYFLAVSPSQASPTSLTTVLSSLPLFFFLECEPAEDDEETEGQPKTNEGMNERERHEIYAKIGFGRMLFDFLQPPLDREKNHCPMLLLTHLSSLSSSSPSVPLLSLLFFLWEYYSGCYFFHMVDYPSLVVFPPPNDASNNNTNNCYFQTLHSLLASAQPSSGEKTKIDSSNVSNHFIAVQKELPWDDAK
eukprot:TRINITY_DN7422_c0_g1_i1.p1 TRINITY_DN7422_c0_g1~~TRINITY_DN7422_c0_g1_i1.p1  ORF type:complete len:432 (+),score=124.01 TRINITY_DN7422_c0_g1_i1:31-1296(+)